MSDRSDRTRRTYDRIAGRFLENTRDRSGMSPWLERFAKRLRDGDAVLDLVLGARGLLHVAVKSGDGSEWETKRYGSPRWFQYWSAAGLDALLEASGFEVVESWSNSTPRADWLVRHVMPRSLPLH